MDSPLIAKQEIHERHSRIMASAEPLPIEIMEKSLVTCFEEQVARHGERVAVHAASGTLTYAALNAAANQLATHRTLQRIRGSNGIIPLTYPRSSVLRSIESVASTNPL